MICERELEGSENKNFIESIESKLELLRSEDLSLEKIIVNNILRKQITWLELIQLLHKIENINPNIDLKVLTNKSRHEILKSLEPFFAN